MSCEPLITKDQARAHFNAWLEADLVTAGGKSYAIGGRSLTRNDGAEIKERMEYWKGQYMRLCMNGHTGPTARRVIPHG